MNDSFTQLAPPSNQNWSHSVDMLTSAMMHVSVSEDTATRNGYRTASSSTTGGLFCITMNDSFTQLAPPSNQNWSHSVDMLTSAMMHVSVSEDTATRNGYRTPFSSTTGGNLACGRWNMNSLEPHKTGLSSLAGEDDNSSWQQEHSLSTALTGDEEDTNGWGYFVL